MIAMSDNSDTSKTAKKKSRLGDSRNKATRERQKRQEELRESLVTGGHVQHVIDLANKIEREYKELESTELQALKTVIDTKLKLVNKYLPDVKQVEMSASADSDQAPISITINSVKSND